MQFPLSWLKSLFPHHVCSKTIEDTLTKAGIEVDLVERFSPPFSGVVCAQVEEVSPHPDATKLQVAQVFDGKTRYQVVCGAKNCRKGLITAFAKPGAILGQKDPLIIAERAVRGVHSQGMLCSLDELGLCEEAAEGIVELDGSYPLGADFFSLLEDEIFHISITPNLGHVLSLVGIARELSAFLKLPYIRTPHIHLSTQELSILNIEIDSKECLCYGAMRLSDVTRTETPFLMQHRLRLAGFNPKSLLVDVLNYVMFEHGQPMHAFNAEKLKNKALIIKNLTEPTDFVALNGKTYICPKGLLAIQSGPHIAAVAGVMGSLDSSCDQQTHSVILESAYFTPQAVRRSLKELDLRTESANRFEKGIDPQSFESTLLYATDLIMKLTGAKASGYFKKTGDFKTKELTLRVKKANRLLGTALTQNEMKELLERLEMAVKIIGQDELLVIRPSYRNDINIEEDLIEEIGRLYGLDHLKGHLSYQATTSLDHPLYTFEKPLKKALFSQGLQEVLTCDLLSKDLALDFKLDKGHEVLPISVLHPRSLDQSTLRMSLLSSFIPVVKKNIANKETNLSIFEVGKTHAKKGDELLETQQVGLLITGDESPYYFNPKPKASDFFDLKGMVANFLEDMGILNYEEKISHDGAFHPYQQLTLYKNGELLGKLGQVHPKLLNKYDIEQKVFYAEFSAYELMKHKKSIYPVKLPPTQPYVERDWTIELTLDKSYDSLISLMDSLKPDLTESISLLDIYPLEDKKNITLRVRYRHQDKSLESSFVDQIHQNFISDVAKKLALSL